MRRTRQEIVKQKAHEIILKILNEMIVFAYVAFLILFILISLQVIQEPSVENLSRVVTNMIVLYVLRKSANTIDVLL